MEEEQRCIDLRTAEPAEIRGLIEAALAGEEPASRALVRGLSPIVQVRAARGLLRRRAQSRGRMLRHDLEDMMQEVFAALFARGGKSLKAWEPERGLSFLGFVGFLAEREVAMIMRTGKRNPWTEEPTRPGVMASIRGATDSHEEHVASRQMLVRMAERLRERLSPLGRHYLQLLVLEQRPVQQVAEATGASTASLYAWRSRLAKMVREVREELVLDGE